MQHRWRSLLLVLVLTVGVRADLASSRSRRGVDFKSINPRNADRRLPEGITPVSYFVQFQPYIEQDTFRGHVYINVSVSEDVTEATQDTITLHASPELRVRHVSIDEPHASRGKATPEAPLVLGTERDGDFLKIPLGSPLQPGAFYRVGLEFAGIINTKTTEGLFKGHYVDQTTGETHFYVATHFKPSLARTVFPCFDEPALKAVITVSVARPRSSELRTISNMPHVSTLPMVNDISWVWDTFEASPPMSTYAVAFLTSDLVAPESQEVDPEAPTVRVWSRGAYTEQTAWARRVTPRSLEHLEKRLRVRFPLPKLDLVALPGFSAPVPAENWGLVFYREGDILSGGAGYNRWVTSYVVNELTMQWLGGLVTPSWWTHAWLNRALANFIARAAAAELEPAEERLTHDQSPAAAVYALYYEYSKRNPYSRLPSMRDIIAATKAEVVVRMLNATLGVDTFPAALQDFITHNQYGTYEPSDLWSAVGRRAHEDGSLPLTVSAKAVAASWLDSERFPVLSVSRDYRGSLNLAQRAFVRDPVNEVGSDALPSDEDALENTSEETGGLWWIPLVMAPQPSSGGVPKLENHREPALWMPPTKRIDNLSDPAGQHRFLLVNPEDIGLFLVNYDRRNWALLSEFLLQGPHGPQLPATTRAKLVHDALNLAIGGLLDFPTALGVTRFLQRETRYEPWHPFFNMADVLVKKLDGTMAGKLFGDYALRLASPLEKSLEEGGSAHEVAWRGKLRSHTRHLLCNLGHDGCIKRNSDMFAIWTRSENPDANIPIPTRIFCSVFAWGSRDDWLFGFDRLSHMSASSAPADRMYLLKTLAGCARDPWRVERLLNASMLEETPEGTEPFTDTELRMVFSELSGRHTGYMVLFRFLEKHWQRLKDSFYGRPHLWSSLVAAATGHFKTYEELQMVTEFAHTRRGQFGAAEGALKRAIQHVELEAAWSQRHLGAIQGWLLEQFT